jgi:hypothetical protein
MTTGLGLRSMLVGRESYRVIQTECKDSFSWNAHLLALGEHLGSRSPGGADCGSDGCALSVTNYCTNNCISDWPKMSYNFPAMDA